MKARTCVYRILLVFLLTVYLDISIAFTLGLSRHLQQEHNEDIPVKWSLDEILPQSIKDKRECSGFPCMYTHLGSKAGRASLYRTLAGIIGQCYADPHCNPGRRKKRQVQKQLLAFVGKHHSINGKERRRKDRTDISKPGIS